MKKAELVTMKARPESLKNFNHAAKIGNMKQYEIVHEASEDVLRKISEKIKKQKK